MKFRTSSFNSTAFKKDLTRFAPAWVLYFVMLALILLDFSGYSEYAVTSTVADCIGGTSVLMMFYACLVAQLLFGDLFNSRMCNMLHAMPLRRECLFGTHVTAGLLFALVPNLLISLFAVPMMGDGWTAAFWWLLAATLEYVFFFGLAIVCVMSVGSRFAQVVVYGITNFASIIAYGFASVVYEPLLTGIRISEEPFVRFSPVWQMCSMGDYLDVTAQGTLGYTLVDEVIVGEGWNYLAVCAVIGVALMVVALQMYRKRKLESAGDFIAVRVLKPVFAVVFALICGAMLTMFASLLDNGLDHIFLAVGLVAGFFVALMLVERTTRVFGKKAFIQVIALCAAVVLSLVLAAVDPMGITRRVPDAEDVESVTIGTSYYSYRIGNGLTLTEEEDIQAIVDIHYAAVYETGAVMDNSQNTWSNNTQLGISYTMKDGSSLKRYYIIPVASDAGEVLEGYYSSVESVTGMTEEELYGILDSVTWLYVDGWKDSNQCFYEGVPTDLDMKALLDAIVADCEAGNMAQVYEFRNGDEEHMAYISLAYMGESDSNSDSNNGIWLDIYSDAENVLKWLEDSGLWEEME